MPAHESTLRAQVISTLAAADAIAVENPVLPGTPDVNFIEGWIELKSIWSWPSRADTLVRVPHFTPQQRVWHVRRSRAGGRTYVLLEAVKPNEYVLLFGAIAARILGKSTRAELVACAEHVWLGRMDMKAGLLPALREPLPRD